MTILNADAAKNLFYASILYELHIAKDKLNYFRAKYNTDFQTFEQQVKLTKEEDFEKWDDYMEWKAFVKTYQNLTTQKNDIENGNIRVA